MADGAFEVRRFSDDFARLLRDRIVSGEMAGGDRLNEVQLSQEYGISRSPIREALMTLAGEGLVSFVAGRGAFVREVSVDEVRDLGEVRQALESFAVEAVAGTATAEQIAGLSAHLNVDDQRRSSDADFHRLILELAGNERLTQYAQHVIARLRMARARSADMPGRIERAKAEHRVIVDAISAGDALAASAAMREHIARATESACSAIVNSAR